MGVVGVANHWGGVATRTRDEVGPCVARVSVWWKGSLWSLCDQICEGLVHSEVVKGGGFGVTHQPGCWGQSVLYPPPVGWRLARYTVVEE